VRKTASIKRISFLFLIVHSREAGIMQEDN
jgi:hypothetical protein